MKLLRRISLDPGKLGLRRRPRPASYGRTVSCSVRAKNRTGVRGFTLIEIALVLLLIGILATMAVYTYHMMVNKARMTQAKTSLRHLVKTETIYFSDHSRYTQDISLLNFGSMGYNYYVVSVQVQDNGMTYIGTAEGVGAMKGDRWHVTNNRELYQDNTSPFK